MKLFLSALFALVVFAGHSSCKKSCHTWGITGVSINRSSSIPDNGAIVVQYEKSGDFATVVDAFYNMPTSGLTGPDRINVSFPVTSADSYMPYNYDWIVILLPSGRTYKIRNISHDNKQIAEFSIGMGSKNGYPCTNRTDYVMNDVALSSKDGYAVSSGSSTIALRFAY
ncbi:MAG: hypothetical protein K0Q79_464 [Flavipsychrobacter sp.]|jgi:hypothetical protein|nr:hypothetical protein [Flavipsychrobacter sp.]